MLYLENDRADRSPELIRYVDALGYEMYWHLPALYSPQNFFGNSQNVFGNIISQNMLCIHRDQPHDMQGFERVPVPPAQPAPLRRAKAAPPLADSMPLGPPGRRTRFPRIARHDV